MSLDLLDRPSGADDGGPARAVLYLRVSTPGQVKTDYDPEGLSIPAQREACELKARQMGVEIVGEYVEPGKSAREMSKRPAFQAMLTRIRDQRDVQYVILHRLSRANRNRFDEAWVVMELRKVGATLISATEHIDDTPVGQLLHGLLAAVNEYRSAEDGADIRYKMSQKAKRGGTLGRAKLGYLNVRETIDDEHGRREVRAVAVDPERAHFVTLAFELFATNEYTLEGLCDTLNDRGLRTRPSGRHPGGPITDSTLSKVLRDRYYLGYVTYKGVEYKGRHQPLVTPEVFDQVQKLLESRTAAGERQRKHHHYLKGSLWCGRCHAHGRESRMVVERANGNGGTYWYFFCRARKEHTCTQPYRDMDQVEDAVLRHYATVELGHDVRQQVRDLLHDAVADRDQATKLLRQQLKRQLAKLDVQENNLLDLAADGKLATGKVRQRLHRIQEERTRITAQLADTDDRLEVGVAVLDAALALLDDLQEAYRQTTDHGRRLLNQAIFEKLYIDGDTISPDVLHEPFHSLVTAQRAAHTPAATPTERIQAASELAACNPDRDTNAALLTTALLGDGSNKAAMVGREGLEPPTPCASCRCSSQLS
jgi:site-specific DNA recombinase